MVWPCKPPFYCYSRHYHRLCSDCVVGLIKRADKGPILLLFVATKPSFSSFGRSLCQVEDSRCAFTRLCPCTIMSLCNSDAGLAQVMSGQPFFLKDLSGRSKALERLRYTAVNADDMNNGLNFFFAHTIINRATAMHFPLVHLS